MININKVTKIYLVENCYGDLNKVYIGKEKSHQKYSRKNNHQKTFGKQIKFTYIDETQGWSKENWKQLECFWIQYFKFLGFELMNKNEGGNGVGFHTQQTKNRMSKIRLGKQFSETHKNNLSIARKGKKFTQEHCLNIGKGREGWEPNEEMRKKMSDSKIGHKCYKNPKRGEKIAESLSKLIIQCDLENNPIGEWISIKEAKKNFKGDIGAALQGRQKTAAGFKWKYKK
jgi:hypothetical protein